MSSKRDFEDDERRARAEADVLWRADGRPAVGVEFYLDQAREIVALKDSSGATLTPVEETKEEPVEPPLAIEGQADMPGLDDFASSEHAPSWDTAREIADTRGLSADTTSASITSGSPQMPASATATPNRTSRIGRKETGQGTSSRGENDSTRETSSGTGLSDASPGEETTPEDYERDYDQTTADLDEADTGIKQVADTNGQPGYNETADGLSDIEETTREQAEDRGTGDDEGYRP